jgi:hypothetical protein
MVGFSAVQRLAPFLPPQVQDQVLTEAAERGADVENEAV